MYSVVFLSLLVLVAAAPHHYHYNDYSCEYDEEYNDSHNYWKGFWQNFYRTMDQVSGLQNVFQTTRHQNVNNERKINVLVEENQYIVSMFLPGYEKSDIKVIWNRPVIVVYVMNPKDRNGAWTIYQEMSLPENVSKPGKWSFQNNILIIKFVIESTQTDQSFAIPKVNVKKMNPEPQIETQKSIKHDVVTILSEIETRKPGTTNVNTITNIGTQGTMTQSTLPENTTIKPEMGTTRPDNENRRPATKTIVSENRPIKPASDTSQKDKAEPKIYTSTIVPKNFDWSKNYFGESLGSKDNNNFQPIQY